MDWPAYSPDLNPIEHVWDMLSRRIAARQPPPICLPELRRALLDERCNIPQDQIDSLILSMPRRCKVDLVANSSSSLSSYASPNAPDNALPLSEDPDGIFRLLFTEITQILWKSV
ncbi:DDE_3 domain-containing protein [Trichonephila clavipes]|nr:DDE_3 domain-containing protein [Trichonephila clavipes]